MNRASLVFAVMAATTLALAGCGRDESVPPSGETGAPVGALSSGPPDTARGTVSGDAAGSTGAITTTPDAGVAATPGALTEREPTAAGAAPPAASAVSAAQ